jgi:26S proteasome regulatory subunit N3
MKKEMQLEKPSSPALKKPKIVKEGPQDVEMKEDEKKEIEEPKIDADLLTLEDIREQVKNIEKAVSSKEPRFITRTLRAIVTLRRKLNNSSTQKYFSIFSGTTSYTQRTT